MRITRAEALHAFNVLAQLLEEAYGIMPEELLTSGEPTVPAGIFRRGLPPFVTLSSYLHQQGHDTKEIARLLKRNRSFVNASIRDEPLTEKGTLLPVSIFQGELSILEAATEYLKSRGLSNAAIAKELGKSQSHIWLVLKRADRKLRRRA